MLRYHLSIYMSFSADVVPPDHVLSVNDGFDCPISRWLPVQLGLR